MLRFHPRTYLFAVLFFALTGCNKQPRTERRLLTDTTRVPVTAKVNGWVRHKYFGTPYAHVAVYVQAVKVLHYYIYPPDQNHSTTTLLVTNMDSAVTDVNGYFIADVNGSAAYDNLQILAVVSGQQIGESLSIVPNQANDSVTYPITTSSLFKGQLRLTNNNYPPVRVMFDGVTRIVLWQQTDTVTHIGGVLEDDTVNVIRYEYTRDNITHSKVDTIRLDHHEETVNHVYNINPATF